MFRPDQQLGPYTLLRELGRGASGVVWLAEKRGNPVVVQHALKLPLIGQQQIDELLKEGKLWVQASGHPNVLPVIEVGIFDGQVVIVGEYAPEGSLAVWLQKNGARAPTTKAAEAMCAGILSGLAHLHGRGIVHRDLKPSNILLQGEIPRIADFGLARLLNGSHNSERVAGTPAYMAPEAWDGIRSEKTDLWSVGVILYEMVAGRRPFPQSDRMALWSAIKNAEPDSLPGGMPSSVAGIVSRALQKDPGARYESVAQMLAHLRGELTPLPPTTLTLPRDEQLLTKFDALPKRYQGREVIVSFTKAPFHAAYQDRCEALGLPVGDTMSQMIKVDPGGTTFEVYAQGEVADRLLDIAKGSRVTARVRAIFAESTHTDITISNAVTRPTTHKGLLIVEIIQGTA